MKNSEIAALFEKTADVLAILGENSFRVIALKKVARTLEDMPQDVAELAKTGALDETPGIGESSAKRIREYLKSGHIAEFEETWTEVPAGVMAIMKIPTVGPKTAALLWKEAGITTVEDLKEKIEKKQIPEIKGMGEKKLQKIAQNIAFLAQSSGRIRLGEAYVLAIELVAFVKSLPHVLDANYGGSLRRGQETIGDIDIAVSAEDKHAVGISTAVVAHPLVAEVIAKGESKTSFRTAGGVQVDVRVVPPASYGAAMQYFTGNINHNVKLRQRAIDRGLKLNEWGVFKSEKSIAGKTEPEVYAALDLAWIPPEMRQDKGEIEAAEEAFKKSKSKKPITDAFDLVTIDDIKGDLHMHTVASDGSRSIEEMVAECKRRGFQYCAITDHSKSQFQANGLSVDRLVDHVKAIHAVAKKAKGILVLAGSEVDILADGSLDYEDDLLKLLDWVVASPHAALTQDTDAATARLVRACANPYVTVIGHPTGRLVPSRKGLEPDMQKVIFAAARNGVALEINANTHRLDLRDTHARLAAEAGVPLVINTDAHSFDDMDQMLFGVLTARRGWAAAKHILNTRTADAFQKWLKDRKAQADFD